MKPLDPLTEELISKLKKIIVDGLPRRYIEDDYLLMDKVDGEVREYNACSEGSEEE